MIVASDEEKITKQRQQRGKAMEKVILGITLTVCLIVLTILPGCSGRSLALVPKSEFDECTKNNDKLIDQIESFDVQKSGLEIQLSELEAEKLSLNSTIKAKDDRMIELEE